MGQFKGTTPFPASASARLDHDDRTRAHHRLEIRRWKAAAFAHLDHPDARRALQAVRWRKDFTSGELTIERVYLITSLPPGASTGAQLADWIGGHWKIENLLHHVRHRTFREDDSKIHVGLLPHAMVGLRNLAIGVHRQDGHTNIAAASRPPPATGEGPSLGTTTGEGRPGRGVLREGSPPGWPGRCALRRFLQPVRDVSWWVCAWQKAWPGPPRVSGLAYGPAAASSLFV
ncbi:transposase [Streptomyces sp. NPDC001100]